MIVLFTWVSGELGPGHMLRKLHKDGLVEVEAALRGGREIKRYRITEGGRVRSLAGAVSPVPRFRPIAKRYISSWRWVVGARCRA